MSQDSENLSYEERLSKSADDLHILVKQKAGVEREAHGVDKPLKGEEQIDANELFKIATNSNLLELGVNPGIIRYLQGPNSGKCP